MPQLSIILIVKNEADCLGDCLESVSDIADEIVVVDTGSTDDTIALAEAAGARVSSITWPDDFALARNASIAAATGDWLLHMDADEVLDEAGAAQIRALVDADGDGADAIELMLANYCNDPRAWRWVPVAKDDPMAESARGAAGYIGVPLLRLFRNHRGYEYREAVHENITESVREAGGTIGAAHDIIIHHYGYGGSDTPKEKLEFYLRLARKKSAARPDDPKTLHDLAEQALACGHSDEAETACRRALALVPDHLAAATTLANILLSRGDLDEAETLLRPFAQDNHTPPHVHVALGAIACRQGKLDDAAQGLRGVLSVEPRNPMARIYLARVHDLQGSAELAHREFALLHDLFPAVTEFRDLLRAHELRTQGETLFGAGHAAQALESLVEALRLDPEDPLTHNAVGVVAHTLGENDRARAAFVRALQLAPGHVDATANLEALG